ncbi:hypothetical protein [Acutalibacter intestini]|uniref:hypothetical protein n=1 Tax=Acutalibacter intestini TaxID=3093659 RepID=UPI002AC89ADA|nr:hypothetical protein [Acutalibacter sp. M00204]
MFKKKKAPLFGGEIPPDCQYCTYNGGPAGSPACTLHKKTEAARCKAYRYDPLKREPLPAPPLRTRDFDPEDFKL